MRKTGLTLFCACLLALAGAGLRAGAPGSADTVTLKDGRVVHGVVVAESASKVVVLVDGVQRSYSRDLIRRVAYGSGPAGDAGQAYAQAPGAAPKGGLVADLASRYRVPESDVLWVRSQGIPDADLPLVFLVAATAQVPLRAVVRLRLDGASWADIEAHFGMDAQYVYYGSGPWGPYPYYAYPGWWGPGWGVGLGWGWGRGYWGGHWGGRWR